ncbi:MAG TPA: hypothetical protein VGS21_09940 [Acidimicrobiales bacterium]|nr:hypothetical protein [Acidimicrobiales bacterium]
MTTGSRPREEDHRMGDFLVAVAIVAFTASMLGLIWLLERV